MLPRNHNKIDKVTKRINRFDPNTRSKIALLPADKNLAFRKLSEFIEPINIPKVYGGELDWDFGDFPAVEPEITKALGMDLKDWPRGPAKVVGDELIAVGKTEDGIQRNTVLGRFQM